MRLLQEGEFWRRERWPATMATLIAILLFAISSGQTTPVTVLVVLALLGYYFGGKLNRGSLAVWAIRIVVYLTIYVLNVGQPTTLTDTIIVAQWATLFGLFAIAEFGLRRWQKGGDSLWVDVLPSGVIMFAACSTMDPLYVTFLAPLYFLFLVLAFAQIGHRADARLSWRWLNLATRITSLILAVLIGAYACNCFRVYKAEILEWGTVVLGESVAKLPKSADVTGIDKDPSLGAMFDSGSPSTRMLLIHGDLSMPYLRGMAYDTYDKGTWSPTLDARGYHEVGATLAESAPAGCTVVGIDRLVSDDDMIAFPLTTVAVRLFGARTITWALGDGGPLKATHEYHYTITVPQSDTYQGIACVAPNSASIQKMLAVPSSIDPRVVALGKNLKAGDEAATIQNVERYLMTNNRYSLNVSIDGGDPISNFILKHKAAYCEYFASAAAILLRSAGVPTRFVIGYYAHEPEGDGMVVRAEDAHAWAESYVTGIGWVTVDATPASGRPSQTAKPQWWWNIRDAVQDALAAVRNTWARMSRAQQSIVLVVIALLAFAYYLLRNWHARRMVSATITYGAPSEDIRPLAERFERYLTSRAATCPPALPWRDYLENVRSEPPSEALDTELAQLFVTGYSAARFGATRDAKLLNELDEILSNLESEKK